MRAASPEDVSYITQHMINKWRWRWIRNLLNYVGNGLHAHILKFDNLWITIKTYLITECHHRPIRMEYSREECNKIVDHRKVHSTAYEKKYCSIRTGFIQRFRVQNTTPRAIVLREKPTFHPLIDSSFHQSRLGWQETPASDLQSEKGLDRRCSWGYETV